MVSQYGMDKMIEHNGITMSDHHVSTKSQLTMSVMKTNLDYITMRDQQDD